MQLGKELEKRIENFWGEFIGMEDEARKEAHRDISGIIMDALDRRSAEEDDLPALRSAARLCTSWRVFGEDIADEFTERFIKAVRELDESRGVTKECRILWIRVLMSALDKHYIREAAKDIRVSHLNMFFYHALEAETDEDPNRDLMVWYEELIDRGILYKYECRMFNRLAYFWLTAYDGQDHIDRAKAYFKAMERRGINFENPYKGFYGKSDHEELVGYLLNDEYDRHRRKYLNEYVSALAKEIADGNADETDLRDLGKTVDELHRENYYGKGDANIETWDRAVIDMSKALEKCCERLDDESSTDAAGVLAECMAQWDNWLLKYIETENKGVTKDSYYSLIEKWEQNISRIPGDRAWVMLSSLREMLINRYNETGETEKLIQMLEKHTADTDAAAHLRDWFLIEDIRGKRYCTHNTMALIDLLIENGDRPAAEKIIDRITSDAEDVEKLCCYDISDDFRSLWLKYIILLERHGYIEESQLWREKLKTKHGLPDEDISCEISYLKGNYKEALDSCEGEIAAKGMLEYIVSGELSADADMGEVEILKMKSPGSIHCRSSYVGEEMRTERQLTNAEWHQFHADMKTLARMFENSLKGDATHRIYPADYYKAELSYEPEPPVMRGDYIKYFYENDGKVNWLGLTTEDYSEIEKAVAEVAK